MKQNTLLQSITTKDKYPINEVRYRADNNEILEVVHTYKKPPVSKAVLNKRLTHLTGPFASGVWRYKELVLNIDEKYIVSKPEGNTNLYTSKALAMYAGIENLFLKHEGENPTGSFKDRGMTVGISWALALGATAVACASTGNTSASLASYAAQARVPCFVFIPEGKISESKLSQSMAYGAITIQINNDFDTAMKLVEEVCMETGVYLLNSINPFRIEGQKTIAFELLQQLNWQPPDWIILPAGNLGNTSAFGKGLQELKQYGFIHSLPRVAAIQAEGANPFYLSYKNNFKTFSPVEAETIATAIRIGNPVSYVKARNTIMETNGVVEQVSDMQIMQAKEQIDKAGIGCEPASATTVAGLKKLVQQGIVQPHETVAVILTGHLLKDPSATMDYHKKNSTSLFRTEASLSSVKSIITKTLKNKV